ncbi:hypothetical protein Hdeb2414_s0010g00355571 [Helianthus debilis subsp. tardiflorus]
MIQLSETMPPIKPCNLGWACFEDSATVGAFFQVVVQAEEASRLTECFICNPCHELEAAAFSLYPQLSTIGSLLASNRLADHLLSMAGSTTSMFNQTQFEELALDLELSNRPFLWWCDQVCRGVYRFSLRFMWFIRFSKFCTPNQKLNQTELGICKPNQIQPNYT